MINLTFEAETPAELHEQVRSYIKGYGGFAVPSSVAGVDESDGSQVAAPTNDDYRRAIRAIPKGKVAAYSVVSEVVRGDKNGSQKVAGLAANDLSLGTAYRVVKQDGGIAAGFRWGDGRMGGADEGRRALEDEGVRFGAHGRALPEYMLSANELRQLYEHQQL
jgi:alkylated DNA nucleotide flippase Atl1